MDDVSLLNLIGRTLCVTCQISRASGCNDGESFHLRYRERRLNWPLERLPGHGACSVYAFIRVISSQLKWLFFLASCATENGAPPPLLNPVIIREISPPSNQSEELEPGPRRLPEQHTHARTLRNLSLPVQPARRECDTAAILFFEP